MDAMLATRIGEADGTFATSEAAGAIVPVASYDLPAPPSTNALFRNIPGKGRVKTKDYRDWSMHAAWSLKAQGVTPWANRFIALIGVDRHSLQADIDNRVKAVLDAIKTAGVIRDDNLATAVFAVWQPKASHMCRVQVFAVQRMLLEFIPSKDGSTGALIVHAPSCFRKGIDDYGDFPL